jgi:GNAT superfamily N-acetyltransferase
MFEINVRTLNIKDKKKAQEFLFEMVESSFYMKRSPLIHKDIFDIENFYFKDDKHIIIGAFDQKEILVGTIALKKFEERFPTIKGRYPMPTAEVGRCYISKTFRRKGIGRKLLNEAMIAGRKLGYQMLYLHTHPHLSEGYNFWMKNGFKTIAIDEGELTTIHMEMKIN